jgi:hypothetical protein
MRDHAPIFLSFSEILPDESVYCHVRQQAYRHIFIDTRFFG